MFFFLCLKSNGMHFRVDVLKFNQSKHCNASLHNLIYAPGSDQESLMMNQNSD